MLQQALETRLGQYRDPYLEQDLFAVKAVKRIALEPHRVQVDIVLGYPFASIKSELLSTLQAWLKPVMPDKTLDIQLSWQIDSHTGRQAIPALPKVSNMIAVASGKGGVGKSTVAVNLALALAHEGAQVGILDADVYGPSQPTMLGTEKAKPVVVDKTIHPIKHHGLQAMSIGYLIDQQAPMIWRGPMIGKALQQLLHDTQWEALDYLIVDLPPGTGDIQLTLCQKMPVSGVVLVTTPQDLALLDVRRACAMFDKLNVPMLGVVENMSTYHCSQCGHAEPIFGTGGGRKLAAQYEFSFLGAIPLDLRLREMTDNGYPPSTCEPAGDLAQNFSIIARKVAALLSLQPKNYSARFPKVVVEHS